MSNTNVKDTYILIPSYEPDESLVTLVNSLLEVGFEIILVNDGSGEKFDYIFDQVKNKVNYLKQAPNKGKGQALRFGFTFANLHKKEKKFIITCDGDGQHSVQDIIKVNDKLNEVDETVFGVRTFDKNTPKRSRNGNFMSRLCRTTITKQYIQDDQCGLRGFPLRYMDELITIRGDHYEYEMNVVCTFQLKCFRIYQIPIETIYINNNATSHFSPKLDTFRIQRVIWQYDLIPLLTYLLPFIAFVFVSVLTKNLFHDMVLFSMAKALEVYAQFGLLCIFYPTKQVGRRAFIEGFFFAIEASISFGLYVVLDYVCKLPLSLSYFLSTFVMVFLNFPLAYLNHTITIKRTKRR